jgi:hypothetical protein
MAFGDFTVTRASTKNVLGSAGLYVSVANNVPAFEFNTDGTYRGLLVEPGATNQIRNNSMVGAVVGTIGSGGALPTNWIIPTTAGLTTQVLSVDTIAGVSYVTIRMSGTASAGGGNMVFESNTAIVAASGQVWTNSYFFDVVAQPNPPTRYERYIVERTGGGSFVTAGALQITEFGQRVSFTRTLSGGGTVERVNAGFQFILNIGSAYDFTVRIGWPQMETGSVATSPIVTTAGTANRAADVVSLTGASSLIGQTEGTLYIETELPSYLVSGSAPIIVAIATDGTVDAFSNGVCVALVSSGTNQPRARVSDGGANTMDIQMTNNRPAGIYKFGVGYKANDGAFYANGSQVGLDGSVTVGPNSVIHLNYSGIGGTPRHGIQWLRSVALFPTRLANATLETLTTL